MTSEHVLRLRLASPDDADALYAAGALAVRNGLEDEALPVVEAAVARHPVDARLWQVLGLAHRRREDLAPAVAAFEKAAALAPADALIAHSLARATMEAGLPAVERFEQALALAPDDARCCSGRRPRASPRAGWRARSRGLIGCWPGIRAGLRAMRPRPGCAMQAAIGRGSPRAWSVRWPPSPAKSRCGASWRTPGCMVSAMTARLRRWRGPAPRWEAACLRRARGGLRRRAGRNRAGRRAVRGARTDRACHHGGALHAPPAPRRAGRTRRPASPTAGRAAIRTICWCPISRLPGGSPAISAGNGWKATSG